MSGSARSHGCVSRLAHKATGDPSQAAGAGRSQSVNGSSSCCSPKTPPRPFLASPKPVCPVPEGPQWGQGCGWLSHFMTSTLGPPGPSVLRSGSPFSNPHSATHWNPGGMLAWVGAPGGAYCTQVKVCDPGAGLALLPECCIFCLPCVVSWTETGTGTWTWHHGAQGSSRACRSHLRCPWHTLGTQSARSKAVYPPHSLF